MIHSDESSKYGRYGMSHLFLPAGHHSIKLLWAFAEKQSVSSQDKQNDYCTFVETFIYITRNC